MKRYFSITSAMLLVLFLSTMAGAAGQWRELSPSTSPSPRFLPVMATLSDGRVLLFGGQDDNGGMNDTYIFDQGDVSVYLFSADGNLPYDVIDDDDSADDDTADDRCGCYR